MNQTQLGKIVGQTQSVFLIQISFFSESVGFQNGNILIGYILFDFLGYLANTMYMYVTSGSPAQIIIIVVPCVHVARPAVAFVA